MKKMFDLMMQKKWLLLVLAIVVVAALVIGIVAVTGCGEKDPNPTEGTSNMGVTDPTGTTGGNGDNTDPTDPEVPGVTDPEVPGVTDPTGTPENPAKPDNPEKPDDYVEPTGPEVTIPEPTEPEEKPDVKPPVDDPDVGDEIDFGGYTMGTLTADVWKSWDGDTREAFVDEFYGIATPEERHNFTVQTKYNGYTCGVEKHTCTSDGDHENFMAELARGCEYCGKSDCVSFWQYDSFSLFQYTDCTKCPEYDIHKDPGEYCQTCGMVKGTEGCIQFIQAANCPACGEWVEAWTCHHCEKD
jgi:hypothetical protein